jgi:hypothetical protein
VDPFGGTTALPPGGDPFGAPAAADPFGAPAGADPFGGGGDPFAPPAPQPRGRQPSADPFGAPAGADPFGAPAGADPFGAPASADPFGAPAGADPFGGGGDPFAPPAPTPPAPKPSARRGAPPPPPPVAGDEVFGGTMSMPNPYAKPAGADPFAAPAGGDPFGADPFGAPAQEAVLPISGERQAFFDSKQGSPFDAEEPALDVGPATPEPAAACTVVVMGLVGKKKERAAEIVARLRGISKKDALDGLKAPMVTVLQNVSRAEAEAALALFRQADVPAKITDKKG